MNNKINIPMLNIFKEEARNKINELKVVVK